jgi:DNA-binding MarR family transcriptional regulator
MIVHMVQSIDPVSAPADEGSARAALVDAIVGDLRAALGELRCVGSQRLARQGVSMTHLHVLSMLDHHGALTMSRLADLLGVSLSNATGLMDRMEERGFVERERDREDRRVVVVRLAEGGRQQLNEAQVLKEDLIRKILAGLTSAQLDSVRTALQDLRQAALSVATDPDIATHWHAHTN